MGRGEPAMVGARGARPALQKRPLPRGGEPEWGVLDSVGATPLVRLRRVAPRRKGVEIYAKLEAGNPGGSVKDRAALWMVREGLKQGRLTPGRVILEATSGNTGIALAMIGSVLGFPVELCVPANVSEERKAILKAYGAQVHWTDPLEGSDGAIRKAQELLAGRPERYFHTNQYDNPMNPRAHYETTGPEIWRQTEGRVTHFVAGIGTGGTVMGVGRALRERNPSVRIYAAEPAQPLHGLEGLKHMATSIVPRIYDEGSLDGKIRVDTEPAYEMVRRLAREEGLFVGQSSGAAVWAAIRWAEEVGEGVFVTILADGGERYLTTATWR